MSNQKYAITIEYEASLDTAENPPCQINLTLTIPTEDSEGNLSVLVTNAHEWILSERLTPQWGIHDPETKTRSVTQKYWGYFGENGWADVIEHAEKWRDDVDKEMQALTKKNINLIFGSPLPTTKFYKIPSRVLTI